jgi:polyhydroxyalkanoate synthesis regulator phasin
MTSIASNEPPKTEEQSESHEMTENEERISELEERIEALEEEKKQ